MVNINLKNWMSQLSDDKSLFALNISGTHDCVTQYVQMPHISRCQDKNIYEQLCMGVRALDIRVGANGDRLVMLHGVAKAFDTPNSTQQMDMSSVLAHCYKFLDENKDETIIFQFKNDSGKQQEQCFNNLFYTYISKNLNYWYLQNKAPLLGEVRGKIVLIRRCNMDKNNNDFSQNNTGIDFSNWVEQDEKIPTPLELLTNSADNDIFVVQDRYKYKPHERWQKCIKPFLDSCKPYDKKFIICYLSTAGGVRGPRNNAKYINAQFNKYNIKENTYYGTIYIDFPFEEIIQKIIKTNF